MQKYSILWADDEINLLKPHILFLEEKGYAITPINNGAEAVEICETEPFDLVFLDENMPGMSGLEALSLIKRNKPSLPVVMITKSEEEHIMEEAIGSQIADYLIKPLNPNQILISLKKILDNKRIVTEKTNYNYQQDFRNISMAFQDYLDHEQWIEVYQKLIYWELAIDKTENKSMKEVLEMQKEEANRNFTKFIKEHYEDWLNDPNVSRPLLSHQVMKKKIFPLLRQKDRPVFFIVIDNLRFDQWKMMESEILNYFRLEEEMAYYSILPTATAYARNALFSGVLPLQMSKQYPNLWVDEESEEGKNNFEQEFVGKNLQRNHLNSKFTYQKILNVSQGKQAVDSINNMMQCELNILVYNFVDMLSHARTDVKMIRELAPDEAAYRSVTKSWFTHSALFELLKQLSELSVRVVITTDHGTIRVKRPFKIMGERNTNSNLRYKLGRNLNFKADDSVFEITQPEQFHLPRPQVTSRYVFAAEDHFFAYPNNYNYYVNYYRDTFQHGGISLEEVIVPYIQLISK